MIYIRGARDGPLGSAEFRLPLGGLICVRGRAGEGARILAVDVLCAESRRRYMLALSPGERVEVGGVRAGVTEEVSSLPPAVHVDGRHARRDGDSLGRALGLEEMLCELVHDDGVFQCPRCGDICRALTSDESADLMLERSPGSSWLFLAPVEVGSGSRSSRVLEEIRRSGFVRVRVDGVVRRLDQGEEIEALGPGAPLEVVVDRVRIADKQLADKQRSRVLEAIRSARRVGRGRCTAEAIDGSERIWLNQQLTCMGCGAIHAMPHLHELWPVDGVAHPLAEHMSVGGRNLPALRSLTLAELCRHLQACTGPDSLGDSIARGIETAVRWGLSSRRLAQPMRLLGAGDHARVELLRCLNAGLTGILYVIEGMGGLLHRDDVSDLLGLLRELRDRGNTVVVLTHSSAVERAADQVVDLPWKERRPPGTTLASRRTGSVRGRSAGDLRLLAPRCGPLEAIDIRLPLGGLTVVTGPSGSGKTFLVRDLLLPALQAKARHGQRIFLGAGHRPSRQVVIAPWDQGRRDSSDVLMLALGLGKAIARLFAASPVAQRRGYSEEMFRLDVPGGRCPQCEGRGVLHFDLEFLEDLGMTCPACHGRRFRDEIDEVTVQGLSMSAVLESDVNTLLDKLGRHRTLRPALVAAQTCGLGSLELGTDTAALEPFQRVCLDLAKVLPRLSNRDLVTLDLPAAGEHEADVDELIRALAACRAQGATIVAVDHHTALMGAADCVLSISPEGLAAVSHES